MPQDLSVGQLPKVLTEADIVVFNMLDFMDNPEDLDSASFQRQIIIDLGVMMKRGSKLFLITQDFEDMKLENLFSLIYFFQASLITLQTLLCLPHMLFWGHPKLSQCG